MQRWTMLIFLAAISFLPALGFYMVGEEGFYTISSMEMWFNDNWLVQTTYGQDLHRPPLMNWLVMPIAELIGWSHVLAATRLVSITATLGVAAWTFWLCRKLFSDKTFALFATLTYLSLADLLFYRGWLAYTDPIFSFFTFGSMATLWVASIERNRGWLFVSVLLVSCALLSKAFTAYIFYGTVALVLIWQRPYRVFLLSPSALIIFAISLVIPFAWFTTQPQVIGHSSSMLSEIVFKLAAFNSPSYLKEVVIFPFEAAFRLSPAVLLTVYLILRRRPSQPDSAPIHFHSALLISGLCFLPYWLSPLSSIRYLMPIYPFIALVCARIIWRTGESARALAFHWFAGIIALKFIFVLLLAPYYQSHYRGENHVRIAQEILQRTKNFPLYTEDGRSIGLNINGYIDMYRWPQAPLLTPPAQWNDGFMLARTANETLGKVVETYTVLGDQTFLLCRGTACEHGLTIK